jgi:cytidine deaminase
VDLDSLTDADRALVDAAADAADTAYSPPDSGRFDHDAHVVAAAAETSDGSIYTGASLPTNVGRASTCAEPSALGAAVAAGHHEFTRIAAVEHPRGERDGARIISPCGVCRELLADYGDDIRVLVRTDAGDVGAVRAGDLLAARTW